VPAGGAGGEPPLNGDGTARGGRDGWTEGDSSLIDLRSILDSHAMPRSAPLTRQKREARRLEYAAVFRRMEAEKQSDA
jgi:hypothetical protein